MADNRKGTKGRSGGGRARWRAAARAGGSPGPGAAERRGGGGQLRATRILKAGALAPRRKGATGFAAVVAVAEAVGGRWDCACAALEATQDPAQARRSGSEAAVALARRVARRAKPSQLAELMGALASRHRVKLMLKLLEGPATYAALRRAARLQAGPLYHHVAQLRTAGLVMPKERDLYELTRAGRNVLLVAAALSGLAVDKRQRPLPATTA